MATDPRRAAVVLDANILFAALLRDGTTRQLILHGAFDLHAPAVLWDELERNRPYLLPKAALSDATFDLLVASLRARVADVPSDAFLPLLPESLRRLGPSHRLDAPYVACAMAIGGELWSHDKAIEKRAGISVRTTADMLARQRTP